MNYAKKLNRWSRNREFLIKSSVAIAVLAIIGAWIADQFAFQNAPPQTLDLLKPNSPDSIEHWQRFTQGSGGYSTSDKLQKIIDTDEVTDLQKDALNDFTISKTTSIPEHKAARTRLKNAVETHPREPYLNGLFGDLLIHENKPKEALPYFEAEFAQTGNDYARKQVISLTKIYGSKAQIGALFTHPDILDHVNTRTKIDLAAAGAYPGKLFSAILEHESTPPPLSHLAFGLFAATIWYLILKKITSIPWKSFILLLSLAGLILGYFSAIFTLGVAVWMEQVWEIGSSGSPMDDLIYCIGVIGVREELIKFLFFLPLAPFLIKRQAQAEMLFVAGCVGLGFALNENFSYYRSGLFGGWGRFLTANFFHIALTALLGHAFCTSFRRKRFAYDVFLLMFLTVVITHGAYNAVQMIPTFADYSMVAMLMVFGAISWMFFKEAREHYEPRRTRIAAMGTFIWGSGILLAIGLVHTCINVGFANGFNSYGTVFFQMFPIAFLFINQFRDELS